MKKYIFISLASSFFSSFASAYIAGKDLKPEVPIYCPQTVYCSEINNIKSCKTTGGDPQYWSSQPVYADKLYGNYGSEGTYRLYQVVAPYHSREHLTCIYQHSKTSQWQITLDAKPESNLEAYNNDASEWLVKSGVATCTVGSTQCRLKEKSAVVIHDIDIVRGIRTSINSVYIGTTSNYMDVSFDDAMMGCGSVKICKIDIDLAGIIFGSVSVDMDDKMKVTEVTSLYPSWISLNKVDGFNVVEVKYSNPS